MKLRPIQLDAINLLRDGFKSGFNRQVLQAPCAFGKTVIASSMVAGAVKRGLRAWFIVDNIELINQTLEKFEAFGIDTGVIQGLHEKTDFRKQIQVVTAQTITRRWDYFDKNPDMLPGFVIVDECHCVYKAHKELFKMLPNLKVVGMSATPWAKNMGLMYDNLVVGASTSELINLGYLCDYEAYETYSPDLNDIKIQAGDYQEKSLSVKYATDKVNGKIVDSYEKYGAERICMVFCINVAHSKAVADEFNSRGISAIHIDGKTNKKERKEKIKAYKNGEYKVFCSVGIATKGFDAPDATCLIIARPTKSLMLHYQIIGRIMRVARCDTDAIILDLTGNISRLGAPDDHIIKDLDVGDKKDKVKERIKEIKKQLDSPNKCSNCNKLFTGFICTNCGTQIEMQTDNRRVPSEVIELEAELHKLTRKKESQSELRHRKQSRNSHQELFSAFLSISNSDGHASNLFKKYYGVWPNNYSKFTKQKSARALAIAVKFKRSQDIRYAKSKK